LGSKTQRQRRLERSREKAYFGAVNDVPLKVNKPIETTIAPETHARRGWVHKYWARKPHNVVREYIRHFTRAGDIVLDPFTGSGVTNSEALILRRRTIGVDLNPIAIHITRAVCAGPVDLNHLEAARDEVLDRVWAAVSPLYEVKCTRCGAPTQAISTVWKGENPVGLFVRCGTPILDHLAAPTGCGYRGIQSPSKEDITRIAALEQTPLEAIDPIFRVPRETVEESNPSLHFADLFHRRNLLAMCHLRAAIEQVKSQSIRDLLLLAFSAELEPMSKLPPVRNSRLQRGVSPAASWYKKSGFWLPLDHVDGHVLFYFRERMKKVVRAKEETNSEIGDAYQPGRTYEDLSHGEKTILLAIGDATRLPIPDASVHFILTDPPYGDSVPYLRSSRMWNAWLGLSADESREVFMSKPETYKERLLAAFSEMHRVLKPGGYASVWFHYKDPDIWFALVGCARFAGFEQVALVEEPHAKRTSEASDNPQATIKQDRILTLRRLEKPTDSLVVNGGFNVLDLEQFLVEKSAEILGSSATSLDYDTLYNPLLNVMLEKGLWHKVEAKVTKSYLLRLWKKHFSYKEGRWQLDPQNRDVERLLGTEKVAERFLVSIINSAGPEGADVEHIHRELFKFLEGLNVGGPEKRNVKLSALLRRVGAVQLYNGNFAFNPSSANVANKAKRFQHNEVVYWLAFLGKRAGYEVHIGRKEQGDFYRGQKLRDVSGSLPANFTEGLDDEVLGFVEQIDVIWFRPNEVRGFEVEKTTGVASGCERLVNLLRSLPSGVEGFGYVVVAGTPKDEGLIRKHMFGSAPFKDFARAGTLKYILEDPLLRLIRGVERSPQMDLDMGATLLRMSKGEAPQKTLA
jgi:SAM-dependent methyltransferase